MTENVNISLKLFIEYLQIERNCAQYTIESYQHDISEFFMFMIEQGVDGVKQVTYLDIRIYLTKLYEKKLARKSVSRKVSSLRSFYKFLLREKLIEKIRFLLSPPQKQKNDFRIFFMEKR